MKTSPEIKLAKRIILGKNKPAPLLRFICWFTIVWSTICALFLFGTGIVEWLSTGEVEYDTTGFTPKFLFIYGSLHVISIFSGILLYRLKKSGFYLYFLSNIAMVVLPIFYLNEKVNYLLVGITLILIGLFASQWKKLS